MFPNNFSVFHIGPLTCYDHPDNPRSKVLRPALGDDQNPAPPTGFMPLQLSPGEEREDYVQYLRNHHGHVVQRITPQEELEGDRPVRVNIPARGYHAEDNQGEDWSNMGSQILQSSFPSAILVQSNEHTLTRLG